MKHIQTAVKRARALRPATPALQSARQLPVLRHRSAAAVAEAWDALPTLSLKQRLLERNRVLTFRGGPDAIPFDMMRTRVIQEMQSNNWRRLAITSPGADCGKTTVCLNLAFGLARQADIRTAVIDCDLRRPSLNRMLGLGRGNLQFAQTLDGTVPMREHLRRFGNNLVFGLNRRPVPESTELLQSQTAGTVLTGLETDLGLTLTIFDTPPMMATDDMMAFADKVDCVLLVAAAESTTITEIDRCERELSRITNVLGVVLNKCRYIEQGYGYPY